MKDKKLYFNADHISIYVFDGAHHMRLSDIHAILDDCWNYKAIPLENRNEKEQALKKILALTNKKEKYRMLLNDVKTRFDIVFPEDMVESRVG